MQVIQQGESPCPTKPSKQSVLSLGVEAVRSDLSVGRGVREPQCESVKRFSPVSYKEWKPILSSKSQAARNAHEARAWGFHRGQWSVASVQGSICIPGRSARFLRKRVRGIEVL